MLTFSAQAAVPDTRIDVQHYTFRLHIFDHQDIIEGTTEAVIKFRSSGVRQFSLNLISVADQATTGMRVSQVFQDNTPVSFQHTNDLLRIDLPQPASANVISTFRIVYRGTPEDGLIISQNKYGDRTFFGDNWPDRARYWLPTHDHPSDKATCEFIINAPAHYEVIANGVKQEESSLPPEQGRQRKLTHWAIPHPIATKVMVFGAARFAVRHHPQDEPTDIQAWLFPEDRTAGFQHFSVTADIVKFFEQQVGTYPYEKLANVQSSTRYGGMENAGNIFYHESAIENEETIEALIAHEVAHQWFGNAVTEVSWDDVWLSEGFATYFAHLYHAHTYGHDSLLNRMVADRERIFSYHVQSPRSSVIDKNEKNLFKLLNTNTYQKGSWFLHMLRHQVGDKAFFKAIRQYYQTYRHKNASTDDFRQVVESVSGKKLASFFQTWLRQAGHPVIRGTWRYAGLGKKLSLALRQEQSEDYTFPLQLQVAIHYQDRRPPDIKTIKFDQRAADYTFKLTGRPSQVVLDPNQHWLIDQHLTKK